LSGRRDRVNLDDYIRRLREVEPDPAVAGLAEVLEAWKADSSDVHALAERVDRYFGHTWIASDETFSDLHAEWSRFRAQAVDPIGGMTMNERLYWFGLFERYDECSDPIQQDAVYAKLLASR